MSTWKHKAQSIAACRSFRLSRLQEMEMKAFHKLQEKTSIIPLHISSLI